MHNKKKYGYEIIDLLTTGACAEKTTKKTMNFLNFYIFRGRCMWLKHPIN